MLVYIYNILSHGYCSLHLLSLSKTQTDMNVTKQNKHISVLADNEKVTLEDNIINVHHFHESSVFEITFLPSLHVFRKKLTKTINIFIPTSK